MRHAHTQNSTSEQLSLDAHCIDFAFGGAYTWSFLANTGLSDHQILAILASPIESWSDGVEISKNGRGEQWPILNISRWALEHHRRPHAMTARHHDGTPFAFAFQAGHRPAVDRAPCQFHIACNPEKVGFPGNDAHGSGTVGPSLRTRLQTDGANVWGKPSVSQVDHER